MRSRLAPLLVLLVVALVTGCRASADDADTAGTGPLDGPISTRPGTGTSAPSAGSVLDTTSVATAGAWLLPATELSASTDAPAILVSDGDTIRRVARGEASLVADPEERIGTAVGDGRGTVFYETLRTSSDGVDEAFGLVRLRPDGTSSRLTLAAHRVVQLQDAVVDGETTKILYAIFRDPAMVDDEVTGTLQLRNLTTGRVTTLADAAWPNALLTRASLGTGVVALTYSENDTTTVVEFHDLTGAVEARPSPSDGVVDGPPFIGSAVVSPDGSELAYVEEPDPRFSDEGADLAADRVDDWQVVVADDTGEQVRFTVADHSLAAVTIDFDGRWLLVSGRTAEGDVEPLLIDTESTDLPAYLVTGVRGVARIESSPLA